MSKIILMPKDLSNKIAAGEVVERPASIVKELTENSIDANSTAITIEIKDGGVSYIRVTDNGSGIAAEDAETAFLRHATSKLYKEEDLFNIRTLGFRGEALASIAAVSWVEMNTRMHHSLYGRRVMAEGGEIKQSTETGCPEGTSIVVQDLYYNTPARLKFLKKPSAEAAIISDIVSRLILANPGISFKYIIDSKIILHSPGDGSLLSAIQAVYDRFTADNMMKLEYQNDKIRLFGYISNSELEKNNKSYQSLFMNGRYIKDPLLASAVQTAYTNHISTGKFPMYVLNVTLPYDCVDVNVHPNKTEVRVSPEVNLYETVQNAVSKALNTSHNIPALEEKTVSEPEASEIVQKQEYLSDALKETPQTTVDLDDFVIKFNETAMQFTTHSMHETGTKGGNEATHPSILTAQTVQKKHHDLPETMNFFDDNGYRIIGQLFLTYIVVENNDTAYIIDQHAAHERLLFERLNRQLDSGKVLSQQLLTPIIINVNFTEDRKLQEMLPVFTELGYEIEPFGSLTYTVRAVPVLLGSPENADFITKILEENEAVKNIKSSQLKREKLMQTSCKHAIKAGDYLSPDEITELMRLIKDEEIPLSCPHGRPILVKLTKKELEIRFKRIQA